VAAARGSVDADARAAFERALHHDPANEKAKFFLDFAERQISSGERAKP
jgi:cytochrome c-type biogenesis protein CcmH/NrfG